MPTTKSTDGNQTKRAARGDTGTPRKEGGARSATAKKSGSGKTQGATGASTRKR